MLEENFLIREKYFYADGETSSKEGNCNDTEEKELLE